MSARETAIAAAEARLRSEVLTAGKEYREARDRLDLAYHERCGRASEAWEAELACIDRDHPKEAE